MITRIDAESDCRHRLGLSLPRYFIALITVIVLFAASQESTAQLREKVRDSRFNVEYIVPAGWISERTENGAEFGTEQSGCNRMLAVFLGTLPIDSLTARLQSIFGGADGTQFQLDGIAKPPDEAGFEASCSGSYQWQPVRVLLMGRVFESGDVCCVL